MSYATHRLNRATANALYAQVLGDNDIATIKDLALNDLFFLLTVVCCRRDMDDDWLYARCREVERDPNDRLDLWAREHYKSTIITFGLTIQDILRDPDLTVGIFSHTRPIAKAFVKQIKQEFENNTFMIELFPDVLYQNPQKEASSWSIENGITVKRTTNPKECTIEAWGLVDGQPTSKHYRLMVYDDVVTRESVTNTDMIRKVNTAWELSRSLGAEGGSTRYIGTRYHFNDTYSLMMERKAAIPRIHPATHNGQLDGTSVFLSPEYLQKKLTDTGSYTFSAQMLQNPIADTSQGFRKEWVQTYTNLKKNQPNNRYLLCDPAGEKKKGSDFTTMLVIGLFPDGNYYLLDGIRDRMNLTERTRALIRLHRKWRPKATGYEKYGKASDIEHIKYVMEQEEYRFQITPLGGAMAKNDRIRRLVPLFEFGRVYMPPKLGFHTVEGAFVNLISTFIEDEFLPFPVGKHDDMLDCLSRIFDISAVFPIGANDLPFTEVYDRTDDAYEL